jgi:hypothetical protein
VEKIDGRLTERGFGGGEAYASSKLAQFRPRPSVLHLLQRPAHLLLLAYLLNFFGVVAMSPFLGWFDPLSHNLYMVMFWMWLLTSPSAMGGFLARGMHTGAFVAGYPLVVAVVSFVGFLLYMCLPASVLMLVALGFIAVVSGCVLPFFAAGSVCELISDGSQAPSVVVGCGRLHGQPSSVSTLKRAA